MTQTEVLVLTEKRVKGRNVVPENAVHGISCSARARTYVTTSARFHWSTRTRHCCDWLTEYLFNRFWTSKLLNAGLLVVSVSVVKIVSLICLLPKYKLCFSQSTCSHPHFPVTTSHFLSFYSNCMCCLDTEGLSLFTDLVQFLFSDC